MDTPKDICGKYCKQRLQKLVDDKTCPFSLVSSEIEQHGDELTIKTVCEGCVESAYKTIIDRISKVNQNGVIIIKEIIKHEKQRQYADNTGMDNDYFKNVKIGDSPFIYPAQCGSNINIPWVYTTSINSFGTTTYGDTK